MNRVRGAARLVPALLALALLAAPARAGEPPVDYQEPPADPPNAGALQHAAPGQFPGEVPDRLIGAAPYQRLPLIDESEWVTVEVRKTPYWTAGVRDPVLTDACRLGDFASLPLNRMVARFEAPEGRGVLQVVLPDRRNLLVDRRNLAAPGEIYYFHDTALPTCEVWVDKLVKPRKLNAQGNSLPPPDPQALAKEKAMIENWPKQ